MKEISVSQEFIHYEKQRKGGFAWPLEGMQNAPRGWNPDGRWRIPKTG
jgi:hypothetical protein